MKGGWFNDNGFFPNFTLDYDGSYNEYPISADENISENLESVIEINLNQPYDSEILKRAKKLLYDQYQIYQGIKRQYPNGASKHPEFFKLKSMLYDYAKVLEQELDTVLKENEELTANNKKLKNKEMASLESAKQTPTPTTTNDTPKKSFIITDLKNNTYKVDIQNKKEKITLLTEKKLPNKINAKPC